MNKARPFLSLALFLCDLQPNDKNQLSILVIVEHKKVKSKK